MLKLGTVTERIDGAHHGFPGLSLVTVARAGGVAFALERWRKEGWRRLHSYTMTEARALAELVTVYMALSDAAEPNVSLYDDAELETADVPF